MSIDETCRMFCANFATVLKFTGNFVDFFLPLLSLQFTLQFDGKFHGHCSEKDKNRCTQLYTTLSQSV